MKKILFGMLLVFLTYSQAAEVKGRFEGRSYIRGLVANVVIGAGNTQTMFTSSVAGPNAVVQNDFRGSTDIGAAIINTVIGVGNKQLIAFSSVVDTTGLDSRKGGNGPSGGLIGTVLNGLLGFK